MLAFAFRLRQGVNKLCFSCGRLGHRKETCLHNIRPLSSSPKDAFVHDNTEQTEQMPAAHVAVTEVQIVDRDTSENMESNAIFGPWMVVSRKRKDTRRTKRNSVYSLTNFRTRHHHEKLKEPLGNVSFEKEWARPNIAKARIGRAKPIPR